VLTKEQIMHKPWKGAGMEGAVARWYNRTRRHDMEDFRREAERAAQQLPSGCDVLEVAPGPGFFSIELARLGNFKIMGLDASRTLVEIATENAREANVTVDFRLGNASEMLLGDDSFDFIYCSAAFKNFSEPVKALDEMYRVLRPGGEAVIVDLRKDVSPEQIAEYLKSSGRKRLDAWMTGWVFRHMLVQRAYTRDQFVHMAEHSRFGACRINAAPLFLEVRCIKPLPVLAEAS
jgi:ubiquinone/menaquinone biosynthesis C-methylase UbiE